MTTNWFFLRYPPSRFVIEASLRNEFWRAGFDKMWLSCVKEEPPYACIGEWQGQSFRMDWDPGVYLQLITKEPNQRLFDGFERMLKHRALAAYRLNNEVYLEWRAKDTDARLQELKASGAQDLERFSKPDQAAA